jgi:predicted metal-dependent enzyme (double-stranded beta helix superfamily)
MTKLIYRAVSMLVSVVGGLLAGGIFKKAWQFAAREDEAPKATDASRGWHEILLAAALQGAIFAVVRATVDRLTAAGSHSLTGDLAGREQQRKKGTKGRRA